MRDADFQTTVPGSRSSRISLTDPVPHASAEEVFGKDNRVKKRAPSDEEGEGSNQLRITDTCHNRATENDCGSVSSGGRMSPISTYEAGHTGLCNRTRSPYSPSGSNCGRRSRRIGGAQGAFLNGDRFS
jgi:hypothetical protein